MKSRATISTGLIIVIAAMLTANDSRGARLIAAHRTGPTINGFDISNAIIPASAIVAGGPGRDGIPSIDRPRFIRARDAGFMSPDDMVVSVTLAGETRAYPLRILVWHEIVNDTIAGQPIVVTYCPLCGTAMVFNRVVGNRMLSFGVSGLLHHSDVLMYDRQTSSLWSQLAMKAISGPHVGIPLEWLASEHLTWAAWRQRYPDGRVLSTRTGFARNYSVMPYSGYEQSPRTRFAVPTYRDELPRKEWVLGIIVDGVPRAYPLRLLAEQRVVREQFPRTLVEIVFDPASQLALARRAGDGAPIPSVKAYWFAWQAFYPQTGLWRGR